MRLCIIGDSHAASLMDGYELLKDEFREIDTVFFAAPSQSLRSLELNQNSISSSRPDVSKVLKQTSHGLSQICVDDFDRFLVYGLGFNLSTSSAQVSSAVFNAMLCDGLFKSINFHVSHLLLRGNARHVSIAACPLPSSNSIGKRQPPQSLQKSLDIYSAAIGNIGLKFLPQPIQTVNDNWRTLPEYSIGSRRLVGHVSNTSNKHPIKDCVHMNRDYGAIFLRAFFSSIGGGF